VTRDDVLLLYEYDRWANNRILRAVSALTPGQFTRDLGGSFRSVRDTLVHIIGASGVGLVYWKEPFGGRRTGLWTKDGLIPESDRPSHAGSLPWHAGHGSRPLAGRRHPAMMSFNWIS